MARKIVPDEHEYDAVDICIRCGRSRDAAEGFKFRCSAGGAGHPVRDPRLARPLAIVSRTSEPSGALEARLVSGDDPDVVVASVVGQPGEFDPDAAFRELDDVRTRTELVYQWVADGLAEIPDAYPSLAPAPAPETDERSTVGVTVSLLALGIAVTFGVVVLLEAADPTVVTVAAWVAGITGALLVVAATAFGWATATATFAAIVVAVLGVHLAGVEAGASRAFLGILLVFATLVIAGTITAPEPRPRPTREEAAPAPWEYVVRSAPAARYVPGLFLVGKRAELCVVIECKAEDGSLVRRVTLPLDGATRESAAEAVRMAKAADLEIAADLSREAAEEQAAAEALERLAELERSRRSLPD